MKKEKIIGIKKENTSTKKYSKNHKRNQILVNLITGIRSLGTIAIVPVFFTQGAFVTALAAAGFFLTDFIDGFLARKLNVQSFFGSLLDAVSDKAFGIVCMLLLGTLNPIFYTIIAIELGIVAINYKKAQDNKNVQSSKVGKAKTCLLAASIVGSYFSYAAPTIKELLNYVNISSFNTLLEINPNILSTILAIPALGASLYVAKDYINLSKDKEDTTKPEMSLEEKEAQRAELLKQKEQLEAEQERISKEEIMFRLFDTNFYLEHKDEGIKQLLYKPKQ